MRQIASILALVTLFACANIFPVKVRFTLRPMQAKDEKFLPTPRKQKFYFFLAEYWTYWYVKLCHSISEWDKKKIEEKYSNIQEL